jgi:pimeloyl-ACP methyl ester carboxylesterase
MPYLEVNGARLHYSDTGAGTETILFSHGLLFSGLMFKDQIDHFKGRYRCVSYDHRGQGGSAVTADGYDIDTLTGDAEALIGELDLAPCHFVGLSMGGFVGLRLAFRRPDLLRSLTLVDTSADPEPRENLPRYRMMTLVTRCFGIGAVVGRVMPILFGRRFLDDPARSPERDMWRRRIASNHRVGIARAARAVIGRAGVGDEIGRIDTPTLIVVGAEDVATVPEESERMHAAIAGSRLVRIPHAGHSSAIEEPHAVNAAMSGFLEGLGG